MIDHISLQVDDIDAAMTWYNAFLQPLGMGAVADFGDVVGYGDHNTGPSFWIGKATDPGGRQTHVAFLAPTRAVVDRAYQVALGLGLDILNEPQGVAAVPPGLLRRVRARPRRQQHRGRLPRRALSSEHVDGRGRSQVVHGPGALVVGAADHHGRFQAERAG